MSRMHSLEKSLLDFLINLCKKFRENSRKHSWIKSRKKNPKGENADRVSANIVSGNLGKISNEL